MTPRESPTGLPAPVAWVVLFAVVITHLPAVGFDFAGRDFDGLARAAGDPGLTAWTAHPWSSWILWSLQWPLLQTAPAGYHGTSLVALAVLAVVVARVAHRMGAGLAGATLAGLSVALGPCTWLAVAWVSAGAEIWTLLFAVLALDAWIDPRGGARPLFGALLAAMAVLSSVTGLGVVVLLLFAQRMFVNDEAEPTRRARRMLLGLLAIGTVVSVLVSFGVMGSSPAGSAAPSLLTLRELPLRMAETVWPVAVPAHRLLGSSAATTLGIATLALAFLVAIHRGRKGDPRAAFCVTWTLLTLVPSLWLHSSTLAHHALGAKIGVTWLLVLTFGPALDHALRARASSSAAHGAALAFAFSLVVITGGIGVQGVTHARGAHGRLADPILHLTSITADVRRQTGAMLRAADAGPDAERGPGEVLVLQAARVVLPDTLDVPDDAEVILRTPVHTALRGDRGLQLLLGSRAQARWVSHLDDARLDATILLDVGDDRLRVLGPVENARIYSALIAIAAGQYSRGRHDLWHAIRLQGAQVRFAFDPDALPIEPQELDAEATGFARYLADKDEPSASRVLRLFEQLYEEVRGRELIRDLDATIRAPRMKG